MLGPGPRICTPPDRGTGNNPHPLGGRPFAATMRSLARPSPESGGRYVSNPRGLHCQRVPIAVRRDTARVDGVPGQPCRVVFDSEGRLPLEKITKFYPFDQLEQAFEDSHSGKVIKPVLVF